jgi:undecaprenol kinase
MKHFFRSFRYALRGVAYAFRREHNFQVEVVFSIIVFVLAVCFQLSPIERSILFAMMGGVLAYWRSNSAVLGDNEKSEYREQAQRHAHHDCDH